MYIDLTRTFLTGMPVYPGDPTSSLKQIANVGEHGFSDHELTTAMHVGTHMDAPLHMLEGGKRISDFPPEKFFGKGFLIDARGNAGLDEKILENIEAAAMLFIFTGWDKHFGTDKYYTEHPVLTENFAKALVNKKISILGLDTPSPDYPPFLVHKILLKQEILIIENLTSLELLLGKNFNVIALPFKLCADAAPARVVAIV